MITPLSNNAHRISLVTVFSLGFMSIMFVFILLSYFTFSRLLSFESTLTKVSETSLPHIIKINQLHTQAATLLESTDILSQSSSNASKRLAKKQLQSNLLNTRKAAKEIFKNEFLDTQLNTIAVELEEFSELIDERQKTRDNIELLRGQLYELNEQVVSIKDDTSANWTLIFSQAIVNVGKALNENKLQQVRFLFKQLKQQLNSIYEDKNTGIEQQLTSKLKSLLFGESGLEVLKIQSLRLAGRTIGKANFVQSLIQDYVTQLGFVTNETEQRVSQQVSSSAVETQEQTQLIGLILIGGVVFLFIISFVFQQRVLKRISIFNQIVLTKAQGNDHHTQLYGNDEITDLAKTFKEFTQTIELQKEKLEHLSMSDGLTGIANRRALDIRLKHDIELAMREKYSVSVLLMDIDNFKLFNDNYGHSAGDKCLKDISRIISEALQRESDFVARYGGEEFICVLPRTSIEGAQELAIHIINKLKAEALPHHYSDVSKHVTLSIGIKTTSANESTTSELLIKQADEALYAAKKAGKNRYSLYG
ncbi:diguanylate cyclase [Paraglaciecola marina]|uniref:diguanylate cyclase n=1 Tax=Paraglaciecola marina TaxID=2500157 RepID=UPI00105DC9D4|nr:diguanylate cyclase [Paraglaciecola marina]